MFLFFFIDEEPEESIESLSTQELLGDGRMGQICSALVWLMTELTWTSTVERLRPVFGEFRKVRKKTIAKAKASKPRQKAYSGKVKGALPE